MALGRADSLVPITYFIALDAWLFLTVLFANFATALAEARGKARADSLRQDPPATPWPGARPRHGDPGAGVRPSRSARATGWWWRPGR